MWLNALKIAVMICILSQGGTAATLQRSGIQAQLFEKDIADAIEFGTVGRPEPYVIRHMAPREVPNTLSKIVASVYTPYIRVALVARAASNSGARLLPSAVSHELIQPVAFVVYQWTCCDEAISDATQQSPIRVATPQVEGFLARYRLTQPLWVRYDVVSVLGWLGLGMAPPDSVAIAAYPIETIKAGVEFVVYRDLDPESVPAWIPASKIRIGQLRPEELARWR